ncbi:MAG: YIP1 family protein [Rudaea sp.]|uniref:Yip1 family protein n=1 Tax=unclassified Rudaea TaxID=2627037 RepID=UPI0010F8F099|nr:MULTISPECIES: Yip1 family protein [unclassified Rudaea]MBN8886040.1 YIP1 family protein [Rudaea sp.]
MDFNKLIARAKNILLTPKTEWPVIAAEQDTVQGIFTNYVMILAAIPAVIQFLKLSIIGTAIPFLGNFRLGIGAGITQMVVTYVLALGVCYLMMLIIDALAPTFGGEKNQVQALKSIAYANTAGWIASVLGLVGILGSLAVLAAAIYGIYLLYIGLPSTMKCPQEKAGGYAAVTIIVAFVLSLVLGVVLASVTGLSAAMSGAMTGGLHSSSTYTPDKDSALGALAAMGQRADAASKKLEAAQKSGDANAQAQAAGQMLGAVLGGGAQVEALAPDALKPFVPDTLGGLPRTGFSVQKQSPMGVQVSVAEARYGSGDGPSYELTVSDMGGAKGLMALAGFAGVESEQQNDQGYEKTYRQGGRLTHEKWNNSGSGEYTIVLGDRFVVAVKGSRVPNVDALKAATGALNLAGLEALKTQGVKNG